MKRWYLDELVEVYTGVAISSGQSYHQTLNDGIKIVVNSPNAQVLQFKARARRWLAGPKAFEWLTEDDVAGSRTPNPEDIDALDWQVDSASPTDPYYASSGGAHERTQNQLIVYDQPDVTSSFEQSLLLFESGKDIGEMSDYAISSIFYGVSVIIVNNRAVRSVIWFRKGVGGAAEYGYVGVATTDKLSDRWRNVLKKQGYTIANVN